MSEKLCVFCRHLNFEADQYGGDYPDPVNFHCEKKHWQMDLYCDLNESNFRTLILIAETCPDYKVAK